MRRLKKIMTYCFITLSILSMIRVHLPLESKFIATLYRPIDRYLSFFSIYQDWKMFAKNPSRTSFYLTAEIYFQDGTLDTYVFPGTKEFSLWDKYVFGERYRKIISEAIINNDHQFMWDDAARFVLRKMQKKKINKVPIKVSLYRHWNRIPDLELEFIPHLSKNRIYKKYNFYTYKVI
jgi:hypothetical protein